MARTRGLRSGWAWLLALGMVGPGGGAHASPPGVTPLGVQLPWRSAAEAEGVTSLYHHHAGLGFLPGWDVAAGISAGVYPEAGLDGVSLGAAARLGPLGLGVGLSRLEPVDLLTGREGPFFRVDLGLGVRISRAASVGFGWAGLFGPSAATFHDVHSLGLSATWRPHHMVSLAAAVDRLNAPRVGGAELSPLARLDVGVRPGTDRLSLSLSSGVSLAENPTVLLGLGLHGLLAPGVSLGVYAQVPDLTDPDRVHAGLQLRLSQAGVYAAVAGDVRQALATGAAPDIQLATWVGYASPADGSLVAPAPQVVRVTLRGPIVERTWESILGGGPTPFGGWLSALARMAEDPGVAGVLLDVRGAPGWSQCWELRQALSRLKAAGKRVHAFVAQASMRAIYLASVADVVHMDPAGVAYVHGLSATRLYYAGLLAKIGVKAQFVRWAEFKSYPESYTREGPSEPSQVQTAALVASFNGAWREGVGSGRGLDSGGLDALVDQAPLTPQMAVDGGLVDDLCYGDELEERLRQDPELGPDVRLVTSYAPALESWRRWGGVRDAVAVIPVVGSIVDGETPGGTSVLLGCESTGDATFVRAIEQAVRRPDIQGIVIRVSSGGGAVLASDRMRRAVTRAAATKPLVVSFGDVAASGGYYLATRAPWILASPTTVTGSIGIFAGKVDLSGLYDKVGVGQHTEKTSPGADALGMHRPWTEAEEARARERLKVYYDRFVSLVAEGRRLSTVEAEARARGRVYAGSEARELGLIDGYGSLWDAVERVREGAGIAADQPTRLVYLPQSSTADGLLRAALQGLGVEAGEAVIAEATPLMRVFETLRALGDGEPLASMPFTLHIR